MEKEAECKKRERTSQKGIKTRQICCFLLYVEGSYPQDWLALIENIFGLDEEGWKLVRKFE